MRHFRLFMSALALLLTTASYAAVGQTFTINGMAYTVLTEDEQTSTGTVSVSSVTITQRKCMIPDNITQNSIVYDVTNFEDDAFSKTSGCNTLRIPKSVTAFPKNMTAKLAGSIKYLYLGNLKNWCMADKDYSLQSSNCSFYLNDTLVTNLVISDDIIKIGSHSFNGSNIKSVTFPSTLKIIGTRAFEYCNSITEITLPDNVQLGPYVFANCSNLTTINLPEHFKCIKDGSLRGCQFSNCRKVMYPNPFVIKSGWDYDFSAQVFEYCNFKQILFEEGMSETSPNSFGFNYAGYSGKLIFPESMKKITDDDFRGYKGDTIDISNSNIETIGMGAFENNTSTFIKLDNGKLKIVGERAFYYSDNLRLAKIPNSVEMLDGDVFSGCYNISHITLPSWLESMTRYESYSVNEYEIVRNCKKVIELTIPAYVKKISGSNANCYVSYYYLMGDSVPDFVQRMNPINRLKDTVTYYVKKSVYDERYPRGKYEGTYSVKSGSTTIEKPFSFNVSYKIPLSMTNAAGAPIEYKTLCRDFDVDLTHTNDNLPEGVEPLRAYVVEDVDGDLRMVFLDEIKYIPSRLKANVKDENGNLYQGVDEYVGVLLRGTPGYTYYYEMGEHDYTQGAEGQWLLDDAMEYSGKTFEKNLMAGDANDDFYVFKTALDENDDELINYGLNSGRFKIYNKDGWLPYNKSYLQLPKHVSEAIEGDTDAEGNANLTFVFDNADGTTDKVSSIEVLKNAENDIFYNPYGQRVNANAKGIVINNGKKYVNK